ncbi:histidine phosphatase family protein [Ferrovibrio sp.]|uniref:histidine phosphatase family protein n=1 Tax=Ferrovibrio sp. TaxID=1917215 RepID=UPI000CA9F82B|nr:histidine phosphatase family protein [Ferrovibrio sp.]PJI43539.1 MAG: phosphoglycerate mutase [Ferrovibrio sp.]
MTRRLVLLRHGATDWNAAGRLQGRADIGLSETGRAALTGRTVPAAYRGRQWYASPLRRTQETAALLGLQPQIEPALIEMDWGQYEGRTLPELREAYGRAFTANEDRGLDLQPPGGESPRQVQQRLLPWLRGLPADAGAVTHKGVIRAVLALAFDWPMLGRAPVKLDWHCLQEFSITEDGRPSLVAANIPLER